VTESEWMECTDPRPMLEFLRDRGSDRTLWWFVVICGRRFWDVLSDQQRRGVEVVERYVEGEATMEELAAVGYISQPWKEARGVATITTFHIMAPLVRAAQLKPVAAILRDIVGPRPFRPVAVQPSWVQWKDGTILRLAQRIYDDKRFTDLPILADALEEAGCTDADILAHCRSGGQHVRGCWVVDMLLAKG
jgi:hypothetical protein